MRTPFRQNHRKAIATEHIGLRFRAGPALRFRAGASLRPSINHREAKLVVLGVDGGHLGVEFSPVEGERTGVPVVLCVELLGSLEPTNHTGCMKCV